MELIFFFSFFFFFFFFSLSFLVVVFNFVLTVKKSGTRVFRVEKKQRNKDKKEKMHAKFLMINFQIGNKSRNFMCALAQVFILLYLFYSLIAFTLQLHFSF